MDPIECAVRGDTTFFKAVATSDDLRKTDEAGNSVLSLAAQANYLACCQEIYKRCPSLLYHQSNLKETVLHHAAWRGNPDLIRFLIDAAAKTPFQDTENRGGQYVYDEKKLLRMLDDYGDSGLHKTVLNNKYEAAELLINADPNFDYGVNGTRDETMLMTSLQLSYNTVDESRVKIRRLLLEKQPNSSKVCSGTNKWTALHHATHQGDLRTIKDILEFCPECAELVDSEGRNFLHLAAKFGHVTVVKYALKSGNMRILNAQDNDGNTPLHIAALGDDENRALCAVCLRYDSRVNKHTVNKKWQKASDALKVQGRVHDVRDGVNEKKLKNQSAFEVVVCTLIAAVSFTAGLTVPGGYINDGVNHGMATLAKKTSFQISAISNAWAFTLSLCAVIGHFCTRYLRKKEDVDLQVKIGTVCTMSAIFAMAATFISGSYAVLHITNGIAVTVCATCCIFFFFAFWAICKMIRQLPFLD